MRPWKRSVSVCSVLLFTSIFAQAQQWDWVHRFQNNPSAGTAIAVDQEANVYVAGTFSGTNQLGNHVLVSPSSNDVFIAKLTPDGEVVWVIATGGPEVDYITGLIVTTNGALFVSGRFTLSPPHQPSDVPDVTNLFVARIDGGRFTWWDTMSPEHNQLRPTSHFFWQSGMDGGSRITLGPDESLWVLAASNSVFLRKYDQSGNILTGYAIEESFVPNGIAVSREERVFVTGWRNQTYFTAGIDGNGRTQWIWDAGTYSYYANPIYAVASTPDGGVVSVGAELSGFRWSGKVLKRSADGTLAWERRRSETHKSVYSARAVAVDSRGNIHTIGQNVLHYMYPQPTDGLWLFSTDASGKTIHESAIGNSNYEYPWNKGTGIAVTEDGATYVTGSLTRPALFGTNWFAGGGAFVARRSTLDPQLLMERTGADLVLSWPRAAYPFALQLSDETGTNWSFVAQPPERIGQRWQVTLPAELATATFRLLRTNEGVVRYRPRVQWTSAAPTGTFLTHSPAIVLGAGVSNTVFRFSGFVTADGPGGRISVNTLDTATGEAIHGPRAYNVVAWSSSPYFYGITCYCTGVDSHAITLTPGHHDLSFIVSDGVDSFTNRAAFEVMAFDDAFGEFSTELDSLAVDKSGRKARALFDAALRSRIENRSNLSARRLLHFQRQLKRIDALAEEQRNSLSAAAATIHALFVPEQGP